MSNFASKYFKLWLIFLHHFCLLFGRYLWTDCTIKRYWLLNCSEFALEKEETKVSEIGAEIVILTLNLRWSYSVTPWKSLMCFTLFSRSLFVVFGCIDFKRFLCAPTVDTIGLSFDQTFAINSYLVIYEVRNFTGENKARQRRPTKWRKKEKNIFIFSSSSSSSAFSSVSPNWINHGIVDGKPF